ncbi:MAG: inositol monophosphatase [Parvularcula sp.]|jgi:fructose-1,6-bisphosphatase/inositol monophosphatase family enzyme|nr:inositol monophosphatase [Parvularcula sp.]
MSSTLAEMVEGAMREAAETIILPRFQSLDPAQIEEKSHAEDLVTVADREAEWFLTERLEAIVAGSKVVGEEAVSLGKTQLSDLEEEGDLWLVDPVDGTGNFVAGKDRFGIMVARIVQGEVVQSWILPPVDGRLAYAEWGAGASFGGETITGRKGVPYQESFGDYSGIYVDEPLRSLFDRNTEDTGGYRQGRCSAYAYLDTARGDLDFVVQYKMTPWDHAAGQLLVEEAGGRFGFLPGGEPYTPQGRPDTPMLITADAAMWDAYAGFLLRR